MKTQERLSLFPFLWATPWTYLRSRNGGSPAVVVTSQPTLSVGIFEGVVRVLEGLVPEEAGFTSMQAGLVLESPVVLPIGGVALWTGRNEIDEAINYDENQQARKRDATCVTPFIDRTARLAGFNCPGVEWWIGGFGMYQWWIWSDVLNQDQSPCCSD